MNFGPAVIDAYLSRKARHTWRWACVIRASDGSFHLNKRTGDPHVVLSPHLDSEDPNATFRAARTRLYALRDEAKAAK